MIKKFTRFSKVIDHDVDYTMFVQSTTTPTLCKPMSTLTQYMIICPRHRRRMEREAKSKVVASVWGAEFM